MAWKLYFRITIATALGVVIIEIGYPSGHAAAIGKIQQTSTFTSLSGAVAKAMSLTRRLQSSGIDCVAEVSGKPLDLNATPVAGMITDPVVTPDPQVRALTNDELAEQLFARVDTPDSELSRAISLANSHVAGAATLTTDLPEDVALIP